MSHLSDFPVHVRASRKNAQLVYQRDLSLYAERYQVAATSGSKPPTLVLDEGRVRIFKGKPPAAAAGQLCAVYRHGGWLAVPTGLVFVVFKPGERAAAHAEAIRQAGYEIVEIPPYAPNAAWVRDANEDIAAALKNLLRLEQISQVENVEPEFITERAWRA
ncbi:MAG: hypothetical protein RMM31_11570 [Anaerolineae bacterium]|nr:hypothetical protein [Thermoflexales bacterium]MDW8396869.1 hypothetical protein [Anaerolineae bacterium]